MLEQLFELAERYPQLATVVITVIVWPTLTGLLSLAYSRLEARFPRVVAMLRASGLDVPRTLAALRAVWPRRLPPPPPSVVLLVLLLGGAGVGCTPSLTDAVRTADAIHMAGESLRPVIQDVCITPVATTPDLAALRELCDPVIAAWDGLRLGHASLRASILAVASGAAGLGSLLVPLADVGAAALRLSESVDALRGAK